MRHINVRQVVEVDGDNQQIIVIREDGTWVGVYDPTRPMPDILTDLVEYGLVLCESRTAAVTPAQL